MSVDRTHIRVKAMLIAPDDTVRRHLVGVNPPTAENPHGYHRLIGGSVELGETHHDAIVREVGEELGATIHDLSYLAAVENIFHINTALGHEIVFLYTGRLDPLPADTGAVLTELDGTTQPLVWRELRDTNVTLPLYPAAAADWARRIADRGPSTKPLA